MAIYRLPPMLVQVGSAETMLDDSKRFVEKAKEAKVDVQIDLEGYVSWMAW